LQEKFKSVVKSTIQTSKDGSDKQNQGQKFYTAGSGNVSSMSSNLESSSSNGSDFYEHDDMKSSSKEES
jgi:hypothetical protein